ncbi:MAG: hypothetical protein QOF12_1080, partial [Solirubrobacteraceae bacterium]|nr:hypothetical protein [Solirubrobacteraceae bacterium]
MVVALALNLVHTQGTARSDLERALTDRARLAAKLTSSALVSSSGSAADQAYFSGAEPKLQAALSLYEGAQPDHQAYLLDGSGRILASLPRSSEVRLDPAARAYMRPALVGRVGLSNVIRRAGAPPLLGVAVPFATKHGRRILVSETDASVVSQFVKGFLGDAPALKGSNAYVVDADNRVLGTTGHEHIGAVIAERGLVDALRRHRAAPVGDRYAISVPIAQTPWRVVFSAPQRMLYAPLRDTHDAAWAVFAFFTLALLALLGTIALALRRSAQLGTARERELAASRLAHERLHDALTGLPNRSLFLDRLDHALAMGRRRIGFVAVLFLDVDHFKRINDSLGHEAGDEVLATLAERLRAVVRPEDTISRFGGDEFL